MSSGRIRAGLVTGVALGATLMLAPAAGAVDAFVDDSGSNTTNNCHVPTSPCATLNNGIGHTGNGDTLFVGSGNYTDSITIGNGKSLVHSDFDPPDTTGAALIDNLANLSPAITVDSTGAGVIKDFDVIRSDYMSIRIQGPVTVQGNGFNASHPTGSGYNSDIVIEGSAGSSIIKGNHFSDPTPLAGAGENQIGISNFSTTGKTVVRGNTFQDFEDSINAGGGSSASIVAVANDISGSHTGAGAGVGVNVTHGSATITRNLIHDPGAGASTGVSVRFLNADSPTAKLSRNVILGQSSSGVRVEDASSVSLDSDVLGFNFNGLAAVDSPDPGDGDVTATNITAFNNNNKDIALNATHLTLDSSIIGLAVDDVSASCTITHSRAPSTGPGDCETFSTTADPKFVDPANGDFHLRKKSPLIDKGDPTAPPQKARDMDGQPRALDGPDGGNCNGKPRRDIGADEFKCA